MGENFTIKHGGNYVDSNAGADHDDASHSKIDADARYGNTADYAAMIKDLVRRFPTTKVFWKDIISNLKNSFSEGDWKIDIFTYSMEYDSWND